MNAIGKGGVFGGGEGFKFFPLAGVGGEGFGFVSLAFEVVEPGAGEAKFAEVVEVLAGDRDFEAGFFQDAVGGGGEAIAGGHSFGRVLGGTGVV